jgi:hypothetical protein
MTHAERPTGGHLELPQVVGYVRGTLGPDDRARVERHLADCTACSHEVGDVVRLSSGRRSRTRWLEYGGLAAAAVVALMVWTGRTSQVTPPTTREPPLTSAAAPRPLAPIGTAPSPVAFAWSRVPGATLYRVTVFDSAGATVFESDQSDTVLRLPDSVSVLPAAPYLWKVAAQVSYDRWASSELVRFRPAGTRRP